jgi:hypothetical protein
MCQATPLGPQLRLHAAPWRGCQSVNRPPEEFEFCAVKPPLVHTSKVIFSAWQQRGGQAGSGGGPVWAIGGAAGGADSRAAAAVGCTQ